MLLGQDTKRTDTLVAGSAMIFYVGHKFLAFNHGEKYCLVTNYNTFEIIPYNDHFCRRS